MAWKVQDATTEGKGYIHVADDEGGSICDIFPFAGVGGVGRDRALENARKIVNSEQLWEALQHLLDYCQEGCPDGDYSAVIEAKAALAGIRAVT